METFEDIYLDLSKQAGRCRIAESGLGWKPAGGGDTFTLDKAELISAQWSRAAKGQEVKIISRNNGVIQLDGFNADDFDRISKALKIWFGVTLEQKEHALRGWNWGKADFAKSELVFNVRNQPAFEIPYSEIENVNIGGKNEVALELSVPADKEDTGTNGKLGGARARGKKTGGAEDELVEIRFYVPGTTMGKEKNEDGEEEDDAEDQEFNAAQVFHDTIVAKAEIGEVAGDTLATFTDILHLTPRGRFDVLFYESAFRLRGKTYDYKIQYDNIKRYFFMPKPDDMHSMICIGIDPPLRQGQTRYPFLVMQARLDEEISIDLNVSKEDLEGKYNNKMLAHYEAPVAHTISKLFSALSGKKVLQPSKDFSSHHNQHGVKCSIKANEGHLFCMEKAFLFVPKPATHIAFDNIVSITLARAGGVAASVTASRTFDITVLLKGGAEHQFSNINREEQKPLESFFELKGLKVKNDMDEEVRVFHCMLT